MTGSLDAEIQWERIIIHLDIDCFYAQTFEVEDENLKNLPLGIRQKQIIVTCNYCARAKGVRKLQLVNDAIKICPDLLIVSGENLDKFRAASKAIFNLLKECLPAGGAIETLGMDEFWINVTDVANHQLYSRLAEVDQIGHSVGTFPNGLSEEILQCLQMAARFTAMLRRKVFQELKFTMSGGISTSKLLSKTASGIHKPNDQTLMFPNAFMDIVGNKGVVSIPGFGHQARAVLYQTLGTVGEEGNRTLQHFTVKQVLDQLGTNPKKWIDIFGKNGTRFCQLFQGIDDSPLKPVSGLATQISIEDSFRNCTSFGEIEEHLLIICTTLVRRLDIDEWNGEKLKRIPTRLRISFRTKNVWKRVSKSTDVPGEVLNRQLGIETRVKALVKSSLKILKIMLLGSFNLNLLNIALVNFQETTCSPRQKLISNFASPKAEANRSKTRVESSNDHEDMDKPSSANWLTCDQCGQSIFGWMAEAHARFHKLEPEAQLSDEPMIVELE